LVYYWFFVTLKKNEKMIFEKTYKIINSELIIKHPKKFRSVKKARVIIEEAI